MSLIGELVKAQRVELWRGFEPLSKEFKSFAMTRFCHDNRLGGGGV